MTALIWVMAIGVGLVLAMLLIFHWRSNPHAAPLVVFPIAFAPLAIACLYASITAIQSFRGMASGEGGGMKSVLGTIAQANEAVLTAQIAAGAIVVLLLASVLVALVRGSLPGAQASGSRGAIVLALGGVVFLGALTLSHLSGRAISFPLAVMASDGGPIQDPELPLTRDALESLQPESVSQTSEKLARYLIATAVASFILLPLSIVSLVLGLVVSRKRIFPRSLAVVGVGIFVLGALMTGSRVVHHRALAHEIALLSERGLSPASIPEEAQKVTIDDAEIVAPVKIRNVAPIYPEEAIRARVEGKVVVEAFIDIQGNVQSVKVVESIPLLDEAALEAVRQWKYAPATKNGELTPVVLTVSVNFALD